MKKICFILGCLFITLSCSSFNVQKSLLNPVYVTNTNKVSLMPVNAIKDSVENYQMFEGRFADSSFSSLLYLCADNTRIDVLMLNEFGLEMGCISYDGITAELNSSVFPKNLKCEYIILDLQNVYADSVLLKNHYENAGLLFEEMFMNEKKYRYIKKKNTVIEEIIISKEQILIKNFLRNYEYKLTICE